MILKGNQRASGQELARHLLNVEDNEHALVHELRGFLSEDLFGAFQETEAVSLGTKCQQYLFSLSLNPPQTAKVSVAEFEAAIADIERRLGLTNQPRAIVFHEKKGRRHAHCVWSRIDATKMRAINLPHFKLRLTDISRELYLQHGWDMPAGLRAHDARNPLNYSGAEASQAKRVERDPAALKELFKACWAASDSRAGFAAALCEHGFCLARGDRRGFVAVDAEGEVYSLSRWIGVKAKDLRARFGDGADLPSVEDALALLTRTGTPDMMPAPNSQRAQGPETHGRNLSDLVARQRQERQDLKQAQDAREIAEIKSRHARLPKGLTATWARLTGQYQHLCQVLTNEAEACATRDRAETQSLIDQHVLERRALNSELDFFHAQQALEQELFDHSSAQKSPIYQLDPRQPLVLPREDAPFTKRQLKRQPDLILAHLSDKKACFTRTDILRGLAAFIEDPIELRAASDRAMLSPDLVHIDSDTETFTTRDYQAVETLLSTTAKDMAGLGGFKTSEAHIDRAIAAENAKLQGRIGASLSAEQVNAIRHILAPNQLSAVVGLAGTGKSTLLSVARQAWERQGLRVHGAALAGKAADSLQSTSGISSRTLASLEASWKSGYEPVGCGDIVVVDEAGMVGTRQLARVAKQLKMRGCKLVLVGDPDQLQPIQAGTPFRDIVRDCGAAHLVEIRRQASEWQRRASRDLAHGQTAQALQSYADQGALHHREDRDQAIAALVKDYMADWQTGVPEKSRLALAHRRVDVHAINQAIKAARADTGEASTETLFNTDHGPRVFAAGDRILFTRNDATLGVRNGMLGTVKMVVDNQFSVDLDPDETGNRRNISFSPKEFTAIDHGFAVSIHRSQGCTVDRSFVLSSKSLDKNLIYVALTRHKEEVDFYSAPDIAPRRSIAAPEMHMQKDSRSRGLSRNR